MKTCTKCGSQGSVDLFVPKRNTCRRCHSAQQVQYQKDHKDRVNLKNRLWASANRNKTRAASLSWVNRNREKVRGDNAAWRRLNGKKCLAYTRQYQLAKLHATPAWADKKAISLFYQRCPKGYHVDHIVPIQGQNVCGLHVLENLQYLPAAENLKKSNSFELAPPPTQLGVNFQMGTAA